MDEWRKVLANDQALRMRNVAALIDHLQLISPDPKEIVEQNSKAFEQQLISTVPSAEAYMTQFIAKIDQLRSILEQQGKALPPNRISLPLPQPPSQPRLTISSPPPLPPPPSPIHSFPATLPNSMRSPFPASNVPPPPTYIKSTGPSPTVPMASFPGLIKSHLPSSLLPQPTPGQPLSTPSTQRQPSFPNAIAPIKISGSPAPASTIPQSQTPAKSMTTPPMSFPIGIPLRRPNPGLTIPFNAATIPSKPQPPTPSPTQTHAQQLQKSAKTPPSPSLAPAPQPAAIPPMQSPQQLIQSPKPIMQSPPQTMQSPSQRHTPTPASSAAPEPKPAPSHEVIQQYMLVYNQMKKYRSKLVAILDMLLSKGDTFKDIVARVQAALRVIDEAPDDPNGSHKKEYTLKWIQDWEHNCRKMIERFIPKPSNLEPKYFNALMDDLEVFRAASEKNQVTSEDAMIGVELTNLLVQREHSNFTEANPTQRILESVARLFGGSLSAEQLFWWEARDSHESKSAATAAVLPYIDPHQIVIDPMEVDHF